jgi:oligopeptide/dipeptide ABC transporter ATP-binding protein
VASQPTPALRFSDVQVEYRRRRAPNVPAVAGVSLEVHRGQVHGLIGESGCGKSTLARAAAGLVELASGVVEFEGERVTPLGRRPRPRNLRRLQMVFQDPHASLNPRRRIGSQLENALTRSNSTELSAAGRSEKVAGVLEKVGLEADASRRFPSEFSGGQRQRICIARALIVEPSIIIADEPISALDASAQAQIANLLVFLARDLNLGVLFISHDLGIVRHVADVVTVMYLGKVVERASSEQLWRRPLHPYTEALISAAPAHDGDHVLPKALPGEVPDPAQPPSGCRFHPRCPHAFAKCRTEEPPLMTIGEARRTACWLHETAANANA